MTTETVIINNSEWTLIASEGDVAYITKTTSYNVLIAQDSTLPPPEDITGHPLTSPTMVSLSSGNNLYARVYNTDMGLTVIGSIEVSHGGFGSGLPLEVSSRGNIGVATFVQDQTTGSLDLLMLQPINITVLTSNTVVGTRTIQLAAGHGAVIGNTLEISDTTNGSWFYQGRVTNVVTNTITLASLVNRIYTTANSVVTISKSNMNVNGAVTPQVFSVLPLPNQSGDMIRMILSMTDNADMDFETFGGLAAITNGLLMRVNNGDGTYRNLFTFRTNGDIELYSYDARYFTNKAGGTRGFSARLSWNGQDKHGVVIRLDGALGESLEAVVQDDLTGLTSLRIIIQGSELQN